METHSPRGNEMDPSPHRRPLTWFDAVILLIATLLGLAMTKHLMSVSDMTSLMFTHHRAQGFVRWGHSTVPLFVCWSLVLLCIRVGRRPRRRLMREPGIAPGVVVAILSARQLAGALAYRYGSNVSYPLWTLRGLSGLFWSLPGYLVEISQSAGFTVAAVWLVLGISRWWKPEPSWTDRAGRTLGVYWIAIFLRQSYQSLVY